MSRETKVPAIPDIREDNVLEVLRAVKSTLEVREGHLGDPLDKGATLRNLVDLNLAEQGTTRTASGGTLGAAPVGGQPPGAVTYDPTKDFTTPPAPTGLVAKGGLTNVYLQWDGAQIGRAHV